MKKNFRFMAMAAVAVAAAVFTGCSSDDDFLSSYDESAIQTRATFATQVINFDNATEDELAGPTSYGANLYNGDVVGWYEASTGFYTEFNTINGVQKFYCGGIAPSNWNIRSNGTTHSQDWWYSYQNQCSVYNTAVADGASNAGYSGSNFGIV